MKLREVRAGSVITAMIGTSTVTLKRTRGGIDDGGVSQEESCDIVQVPDEVKAKIAHLKKWGDQVVIAEGVTAVHDGELVFLILPTDTEVEVVNHPLVYDVERTMRSGLWRCPSCESEFHGNGEAIHLGDCPRKGSYDDCSYRFGPNEIEKIKKWAEVHGEDAVGNSTIISLKILKEQFPELV